MNIVRFSRFDFNVKIFPFILIIVSIIIDMITGYTQHVLSFHFPSGIIFRGIILCIAVSYIITQPLSSIKILSLSISFLYLISLGIWIQSEDNFNLGTEITYFSRIFYYIALIAYFAKYRNLFDYCYLFKLLNIASVLVALSLIFAYYTKTGVPTYDLGEDIKVGTRGFFTAGNDLGLYCLIGFICTLYNLIYSRTWKQIICIILTATAVLLIASKTAILGVFLIAILFLFYIVFFNVPELKIVRRVRLYIGIIFGSIIILGGLMTLNFIQKEPYLMERFSTDNALNPREDLMIAGVESIKNLKGTQLFIGRSIPGSFSYIGNVLKRGDRKKNVEAEIHDTLSAYGYLLGGLIILLFFYPLLSLIISYMKHKSFQNFLVLVSYCFFGGHAYLAGHAFTNVMAFPALCILYYSVYHDTAKNIR